MPIKSAIDEIIKELPELDVADRWSQPNSLRPSVWIDYVVFEINYKEYCLSHSSLGSYVLDDDDDITYYTGRSKDEAIVKIKEIIKNAKNII